MNPSRPALLAALTLALACAAPRPTSASEEGARAGAYSLTLVDEAGRQLPTFQHRGRTYVLGKRGDATCSGCGTRPGGVMEVVASVDGRDVIDGRPAALARRGYLVAALGRADHRRLPGVRERRGRLPLQHRGGLVRRPDGRRPGRGRHRRWRSSRRPRLARGSTAASARGGGAGEAEAQRSAPGASSADGLASGPSAREEKRKGLGTGFGEEHPSQVEEVAFERASARPAAVLSLRYDDRAGLLALGHRPGRSDGRRPGTAGCATPPSPSGATAASPSRLPAGRAVRGRQQGGGENR